MLKEIVTYTNFDDERETEELYFNLSKTELTTQFDLLDELKAMQEEIFTGKQRELTTAEVKRVLELVKTIMRLSYGVRSEDGKRFRKSPELWQEFTETAAYDEFLFSLFTVDGKALAFITGIIPQDVRAEAEAAARKNQDIVTHTPDAVELRTVDEPVEVVVQEDTRPAWLREGRIPTDAELVGASREELLAAMKLKTQV